MPNLARNRYRLKVVAGQETSWTETFSGKQFQYPSGVDLQIEVGIFEVAETPYDINDIASMTLEVKALGSGGAAPAASDATLMAKTITTSASATDGQVDATSITKANWDAYTAQHATFIFSDDESNLDADNYWMALSCLLTTGARISLGWGKIIVIEDGTGPTVAPDPADPSYALSSDLAAYRTLSRSVDHLRDFTGLTGGTATDLDSIATAGLALNTTVSIIISEVYQVWQLQSGTTAESVSGGIVRPDDYAASTNEKIWVRVL